MTKEPAENSSRTDRGEETRRKILDAALALFREKGYDDTTMRAVAERAGVSLGNAYYYFDSKESLLQGYYAAAHLEHLLASRPILERETSLEARLLGVHLAKHDVNEPYHRFAGLLFHTAADPRSPLNPFSNESATTRTQAIALYAEVLHGAKMRVPKDLAERLPELLWLHGMGLVLFWIYDESPGRARTRALTRRSTELVVKLISLASNPLLRPLRKAVIRMLEETVGAKPAP